MSAGTARKSDGAIWALDLISASLTRRSIMSLRVLSPQETRIFDEIENNTTIQKKNKAYKILQEIRGTKPQFDIECGLYFTQSFKETEGQPLNLRWAKAL